MPRFLTTGGFLLSNAVFVLMAFHQLTEIWTFLSGGNPYANPLGETLETAVNLLAAGAIGYVIWSLWTERQLRERLAIVQGTMLGEEATGMDAGELEPGTGPIDRDRPFGPTW